MQTFLITGGAGFIGSNLAIKLKENSESIHVLVLDNLKRRGSELNMDRLKRSGIEFIHGDTRNREDLFPIKNEIDAILDCSAEPSVMAGTDGSPDYLVNTNLVGTINSLELARQRSAKFIFLSTSRVYPIEPLNSLKYTETDTRFELEDVQDICGVNKFGLTEQFPLEGARSLYGATKLCSEYLITEYVHTYGLRAVINRCGVVTGPWQMGKVDQGVVTFWAANHVYQKPLKYLGFGGQGKQVRDLLHVEDLFRLLKHQLANTEQYNGKIFNVGGSRDVSVSLNELTALCEHFSGNVIDVGQVAGDRKGDIRIYLTNNSYVTNQTGWQPSKGPPEIVEEIVKWIYDHKKLLTPILG